MQMAKDLTDCRFGFLTALDRDPDTGKKGAGKTLWRCRCDCGEIVFIWTKSLDRGWTKCCGSDACRAAYRRSHWENKETAPGTRFRKLVVLDEVSNKEITCQCDCGRTTTVTRSSLIFKTTQSCGCLGPEVSRARRKNNPNPEPRMVFKEIAKLVKIRDDFICALCSIRGGDLHAHHIESWVGRPDLRLDTTNIVTLCKPCHIGRAHSNGLRRPPDPVVAEILKKHVERLPLGGALEKHGTLELTEEEQLLILSGVIPERIKRNWDDLSLSELQQTVNRLRNKG